MSQPFNIERGVLQGDIFSPVSFIAGLDRRLYERANAGMTVGEGNNTVCMLMFEYASTRALGKLRHIAGRRVFR